MKLPTRAEWDQGESAQTLRLRRARYGRFAVGPQGPQGPQGALLTARQVSYCIALGCIIGPAFCIVASYVIDRWQLNFSL